MSIFKHPGRAAHGFFSSRQSNSARSSSTNINSAKMGSIGEAAPAHVDSVMTPDAEGQHINTNAEPYVVDFATMHDANADEQKPPLTPTIGRPDLERQGSWLSDDETTAPPPPDFTRRDIHIPSRTRQVALLEWTL
jgi:hypothetical protein